MKKQLGINMIAQILAFAVNLCISFFLTPYIVEVVGVEANGFVGLANNFVEYAQLITVALNSMAGRFITIKIHQKDPEGANKYFASVFIANTVIATVLTVVFTLIILFLDSILNISQGIVGDVKLLWMFIFLNFIFSIFTSIFSVSTFATNRLDLAAFCNIRGYLIRAGILIVCFVIFKATSVWYMGLALAAMGLYVLIKNIRYKKKLTPELEISKKHFDFKAIKELVFSGIWNTISKLSSILSSGLDLLITNIFVNGVAMGVLSLSRTIPTVILSLFGTLANIFAPQLTISYAQNDYNGMKKQLLGAMKLLGLFSSIILAILLGFGKEFYTLWTPSQDADFLYLLTVITCANLVFALPLEPLYNIFIVKNKMKAPSLYLIISSIISIICVFIGIQLTDNEQTRVIIIISVSAVMNIIRLLTFLPLYGAKCLDFKLTTFYPNIIKNTITVAILFGVALLIKQAIPVNTWLNLIIASIVLGLVGLFVNAIILFNRQEIKENINKIKNFRKGDKHE